MTTFLLPTRSDTLPENTRYRDDGCDISPSCLECPLSLCKYDDPGWMQRESKRVRDDAIYRARLDGDAVTDIAQRIRVKPTHCAPGDKPRRRGGCGATGRGRQPAAFTERT